MSDENETSWRSQFESMGASQVRAVFREWSGPLRFAAQRWLAEDDQNKAREAEEFKAEQIEIARLAKDAACEANKLASEANAIARDAAASAALSARAARTNNMIATVALIAAVIAMAISIIGIFVKSH